MSFTDEMYEAMRNFYFHGTQYPCHVGIEESSEAANTNTKINESMTSETSNAGKAELEKSIEDVGDREEQVNCYSNRPSSALFVTNESPPIWFKPLEVFEVSFADITLSRQHTAAAGLVKDNEGRGVALRFPRFKRRRPDKTPEQATTCSQIAQLFFAQSKQASFSTTKM
jgi:ATP-dependent DNA ligase